MLSNYLKIAFRALLKQKSYAIINILGLSVGIASCLLIVLFVTDEFSYDTFHKKADRLFKMSLERKYPNHSTNYAIIPHSYATVIQQDFPEVEATLRMGGPFNNVLVTYINEKNERKQFEENFVMAADSNFFQLFSIGILKGNSNNPLNTINDIVLTTSTATKYFGNEDALGKTLRLFNQDFKVTAICEDVPANSHMKFDMLAKWDNQNIGGGANVNFTSFDAHTYILMKAGTDAAALETKFPAMVDTYAAAQIESALGKSWEDYKREGNGYRYFLQPLTSIHLDPTNIEAKMKAGGNLTYVYFLLCIAIFIVVIACINFMNLATARSSERAREVGVRKSLGSAKSQLVYQFLAEAILISFIAMCFALLLTKIALPHFNQLAGKTLIFHFSLTIILLLIIAAIVIGVLAGSYPAFILSSFNPVSVMKGNFSSNSKGAWLRNGLVVFQFGISIILIVGTLVVSKQMNFMRNKALGYDKEQMLVVERAFVLQNKIQTFIDEVKQLGGVEESAGSFSLLGRQQDFFGSQFTPEGSSEILTTKSTAIDDYFAKTIGFKFTQGHGYSTETNDSLSIILNETAVKTLGIENPIGKKVSQVQQTPQGNITIAYTIIGVIEDFNFQSLRDEITPLTIQSNESFGGGAAYVYVRLKSGDITQTIDAVKSKWDGLVTEGQPFKYTFLDDNLSANYETEKRAGELFAVFSILAIIIACVGLFGLASYTAGLRTKEIGVRKVLGASVASVVLLLTKDFTRIVGIAFLVSAPIAWYIMHSWLNEFAFRTTLSWDVFLIAGFIAILIAWLTVSYQSIKAAVANPVKSLRSE